MQGSHSTANKCYLSALISHQASNKNISAPLQQTLQLKKEDMAWWSPLLHSDCMPETVLKDEVICLITEPKRSHSGRERKRWGPELEKSPYARSDEKQHAFWRGLWGQQARNPKVERMEAGKSRGTAAQWSPTSLSSLFSRKGLNYCSPNLNALCETISQIKKLVSDTEWLSQDIKHEIQTLRSIQKYILWVIEYFPTVSHFV